MVLALCLCTLATYYSLGFVRLLFVPPVHQTPSVRFSWYYVLWSCIYICLRRLIEDNPEIQQVFPRFFGVLWCEERSTLFRGDFGSYRRWTRRQQQSWGRWQNWFPLSRLRRSPSILEGADQAGCAHLINRPLTQTPPLLLSLHPIFFSSLILPKPSQPLEAILLTTINSRICRVFIHHVSESQILSYPCFALCNS